MELVAWMENHFKEACDQVPNRYGVLELRRCEKVIVYMYIRNVFAHVKRYFTLFIYLKESVYDLYKCEMLQRGKEYLGLTTFYTVWNDVFDHVHVKEFNTVQGKCNTCADLDEGLHKCTSSQGLLCLAIMGSKQSYYLSFVLLLSQDGTSIGSFKPITR